MAWVRHGTLVANTVTTVVLPERSFSLVEIVNRDGDDEIFFLVLSPRDASTDPTVAGNDCEVLPASMNAMEVNAPDPAPATVKLISAGTPKYSIRAE